MTKVANSFPVVLEGGDHSRVLASTLVTEMPATEKAITYWRKNFHSFWGALDEDLRWGLQRSQSLRVRESDGVLWRGRVPVPQTGWVCPADA